MKIKQGEERVMYQFPTHMSAGQAAWEYMRVVGEAKTERRYALLKRLIGAGWDVYITREMAAYLRRTYGGTITKKAAIDGGEKSGATKPMRGRVSRLIGAIAAGWRAFMDTWKGGTA